MSPKTSNGSTALGAAAVAAMVLCCLGPALLVTGGLAAVGGFLSTPLVALAGLTVAGVGVVLFVRRTRTSTDAPCCPPTRRPADRSVDHRAAGAPPKDEG